MGEKSFGSGRTTSTPERRSAHRTVSPCRVDVVLVREVDYEYGAHRTAIHDRRSRSFPRRRELVRATRRRPARDAGSELATSGRRGVADGRAGSLPAAAWTRKGVRSGCDLLSASNAARARRARGAGPVLDPEHVAGHHRALARCRNTEPVVSHLRSGLQAGCLSGPWSLRGLAGRHGRPVRGSLSRAWPGRDRSRRPHLAHSDHRPAALLPGCVRMYCSVIAASAFTPSPSPLSSM